MPYRHRSEDIINQSRPTPRRMTTARHHDEPPRDTRKSASIETPHEDRIATPAATRQTATPHKTSRTARRRTNHASPRPMTTTEAIPIRQMTMREALQRDGIMSEQMPRLRKTPRHGREHHETHGQDDIRDDKQDDETTETQRYKRPRTRRSNETPRQDARRDAHHRHEEQRTQENDRGTGERHDGVENPARINTIET